MPLTPTPPASEFIVVTPLHIAPEIIVIAARAPVLRDLSGVSATVIDTATLGALNLPQATDYLRLTPGIAVATSGGLGAQTQVRIRGAEANHTLVFVDGIPVNDPASAGEFLFQTLPADGIARIEVLRGPQSALYGSEAIGGVVSVTTPAPARGNRLNGAAEGGSLGTYRASASGGIGNDVAGLSATASYVGTDGIDISGTPGGDRDGFDNLTLSAKAVLHPTPDGELGAVVRYTDATTRFDSPPFDAAFASTNRALAVRGYADARPAGKLLDLHAEATWLDTDNLNRDAGVFQNAQAATRLRFVGQASLNVATGALTHRLTGAAEYEEQRFTSRDDIYGGATDQRVRRAQTSGIGEYRIQYKDRAAASVSVRHDANSAFADATTVRAAASVKLPRGFGLHGSYGEGVTDPTFTEQFGFFPGSFVGNPLLRPERARGFDAGGGWRGVKRSVDVTYFRTNLTSEIVNTFAFTGGRFVSSVANATGRSHRQGVEVAGEARPWSWLTASATYTWLDATQGDIAGGPQAREVRRPEYSGSVTLAATRGPARLGVTIAYVGERIDNDFPPPAFTAVPVTLGGYALASVNGALKLRPGLELTARVENAFNARYQDVLNYHTAGVTAYGGVRVALGR